LDLAFLSCDGGFAARKSFRLSGRDTPTIAFEILSISCAVRVIVLVVGGQFAGFGLLRERKGARSKVPYACSPRVIKT
jgi:hypothetical protein